MAAPVRGVRSEDGSDGGMRVVLDHLPDLAHVFDHEWRWQYMNPPARELTRQLGQDPDALIGRCVWDVLPEATWRTEGERAVREGREMVVEASVPRLDAIVETRIVPLPDGVLTLTRDVTQRRRLEEDLARENTDLDLERRRLRAVLEILPVGVWIADRQGRIVETNAAAGEIWGGATPMSEVPESYHQHYRGWRIPGGEPIEANQWGLARAIREGRVTRAEEVEIECFDGTRKTILNYAVPIRNAVERVIGAIALSVDITERKRDERLLQILAEAGSLLGESLEPEAAFTALTELCVRELSDVAGALLIDGAGIAHRVAVRHRDTIMQPLVEALVRQPGIDLGTHPWALSLLEQGKPLLFAPASPGLVRRFGLTAPEQRILTSLELTSVMVVPLRVRDHTIGVLTLGTVANGRPAFSQEDVQLVLALATRAALVIENARLYQGVHAASQAKSQFLATMSHELRTPLTAIIGYDELLLNELWGPLNEKQRQQLERIRVSAWHLVTIIDQILTFSRAEAGREQVQSEPVELRELVRDSAGLLEPQALTKQIELLVRVPEAPLWVRTDAGKVRQILLNLAGNAVKFTDAGRVEITLEDLGDRVACQIRDTGPGIDRADRERIFEPFTQLDQSNTRAQGGTGLGLTVSRRLARLLGGDVTLDSEPGAGSTFTLTLPRLG